MTKVHIIGFVGQVRSGKTTACEHLRNKHNAVVFRNSDPLEQISQKLSMDKDRSSLALIGMTLFDIFGRDLLAKHWGENIKKINPVTSLVVIDGLRFPEEIKFYRDYGNFTLVAINSPDEQRFNRSKVASDSFKDGSLDATAFLKQSTLKNESYVDELIDHNDFCIENSNSKKNFTLKLDKLILSIA